MLAILSPEIKRPEQEADHSQLVPRLGERGSVPYSPICLHVVRMRLCVSNECVCILPILPSDFVACDAIVWSVSVAHGVRTHNRVQRVGGLLECFILQYMAALSVSEYTAV
jgi:hypothetical protein